MPTLKDCQHGLLMTLSNLKRFREIYCVSYRVEFLMKKCCWKTFLINIMSLSNFKWSVYNRYVCFLFFFLSINKTDDQSSPPSVNLRGHAAASPPSDWARPRGPEHTGESPLTEYPAKTHSRVNIVTWNICKLPNFKISYQILCHSWYVIALCIIRTFLSVKKNMRPDYTTFCELARSRCNNSVFCFSLLSSVSRRTFSNCTWW